MKRNKVNLNDDVQIKTSELFKSKIVFRNAEKVIEIANIFNIIIFILKKICSILTAHSLPFPDGKIYNSCKLESFLKALKKMRPQDKVFMKEVEVNKSLEDKTLSI